MQQHVGTFRFASLVVKTESVSQISHKFQGLCTQPPGQLDLHAMGAMWLSHGLQPELGTETHTWEKTMLALGRQKTAIKSNPPSPRELSRVMGYFNVCTVNTGSSLFSIVIDENSHEFKEPKCCS